MTTVGAYQTVNQEIYFGDATRLIDFSAKVNAVNVPSQVVSRPRVVLGRTYPRLTVTRVDYRLVCQQVLVDDETDGLVSNPTGIVVLRQTDSGSSVSYEAVISGVPEQAAAEGEIVGAVTFQPTGRVFEADAGQQLPTVSGSGQDRIVVVTADGAQYVRSGSTTNLDRGIHVLPTTGSLNLTGSGFVFNRRRVGFG